jgi:hypothetical protein
MQTPLQMWGLTCGCLWLPERTGHPVGGKGAGDGDRPHAARTREIVNCVQEGPCRVGVPEGRESHTVRGVAGGVLHAPRRTY